MSVITESEKKRLQSLKEKKQAFKAKEQLIQQALRNLDNTTHNKKIIFDDDNEQQGIKPKKKIKKDLFDSDDDSNNEKNSLWNEDAFKVKKSKKTLGNDARFILDDRFVQEDNQTEENKVVTDINEYDLLKEKEKQLDILESILGTPLTIKNLETKPTKKELMVRYDPTENGHCEYEMKPVQPETKEKNIKNKKRDKSVLEIKDSALPKPEVSKDIYYSVSDTLTESLKQKGGFSLLKLHEKNRDDTENSKDNDTSTIENIKAQHFKLNFNANNAFKCDSSDDENISEAPDISNQIDETKDDIQQNILFGYKDTLFFYSNDVRFNEAVKFFSTEATSNDTFNNLRRELKTIVRMKIRNNERRHQPYDMT
ncbi:PREDICTED: nucleolar protein 8-like [Cyphomyrmex costatus]|uniref:nucleolar protein 8-like n=1 Tax=Cyphomyrmex costatus TaxID=456900 RepID=UPI000852459C|nr:PREDICTED: nucleolar protein 8-like [Cyphomyrmex costatus]